MMGQFEWKTKCLMMVLAEAEREYGKEKLQK